MDVVGHHHTTDHGLERWNPYKTAVRLLAIEADDVHFATFQLQAIAFEHLRHDQLGRYITPHLRAPKR